LYDFSDDNFPDDTAAFDTAAFDTLCCCLDEEEEVDEGVVLELLELIKVIEKHTTETYAK
jgi:hypothetical protein